MASIHEIFNGNKIKTKTRVFVDMKKAQDFRRDHGSNVWPDRSIWFTGMVYRDRNGVQDPLYEFEVEPGERVVIGYKEDAIRGI